jgi:SIR2-like domain
VIPEPITADAAVRQMQQSLDRGPGLCLLVGTGLTIAATGDPADSWAELIKRGAAACEENGRRDRAWVDRVAADVDTGEVGDLLAAAEKVTYGLGGRRSGPFYEWLSETVGSVRPKHLELLDQVKRVAGHKDVTVLTTNYDSLLSDHLGIRPVTWRAELPVLQDAFVDHRQRAVIHIHGHWPELSSVVFGAGSYESLRTDPHAPFFLRQAFLANTVATVGVGAGLTDPTFRFLLDWAATAVGDTRKILYFHVTGAVVPVHPNVTPVPLSSYGELAEILGRLRVTPPRPVRGFGSAGGGEALPAETLQRVRRLAASDRETQEASRARLFVSIYKDQVDRVLDASTAPDRLARAWADRLNATWQALNEP